MVIHILSIMVALMCMNKEKFIKLIGIFLALVVFSLISYRICLANNADLESVLSGMFIAFISMAFFVFGYVTIQEKP